MATQQPQQYPSFQGMQQQGQARPPSPAGGMMYQMPQARPQQPPAPAQQPPQQQQPVAQPHPMAAPAMQAAPAMLSALGLHPQGQFQQQQGPQYGTEGVRGAAPSFQGDPGFASTAHSPTYSPQQAAPTPYSQTAYPEFVNRLQPQIQQHPPAQGGSSTPTMQPPPQTGQPDLQSGWQNLAQGAGQGHFQGPGPSNFQPGAYQGQGPLDAARQSHLSGPQVQQQGNFQSPQSGQQVDQRTQQSVMDALMNPSRYGSQQAQDTFNVLNRQLTQQGDADKQRIDEDMARRGLYSSTTAGGRLGDLATNLNQQRADYATQIATDQARQSQADRASAIGQAMGYGGQQFGQGLQGFEANQGAGQQRYNQEAGAGQFGLQQNAQNFGQQYQQYGANQQEGLNRFNAGMDRAQFGLGQQNQNWNQAYGGFGANQGAQQQQYNQQLAGLTGLQGYGQAGFNNQLQTSQFNSDQDYRNNQLLLQSLGYL